MIYTLKNDQLTVKVNSLGAELTSVTSDSGYEYIWQGSEWNKHAPVLFPLCGALLDGKYIFKGREYLMGKHGFAREADFSLVECTDTSLSLRLESSEETLAVYPFEFALTASFSIEENKLSAVFSVENAGKQIMPYMFGWHPAFTLGGSREIGSFYVHFEGKRVLTRHTLQHGPFVNPFYESYPLKASKYYLNEEEIYANDTMIFKDVPTTVRLAGGYQKRAITLSYSDNLPYLCIWKYPSSEARYVCLEPWSDIPSDGETPENFLSRAMSRVSPLEKVDYEYNVIFE
jgi:galactose mutarotase-like enzyme